MSNQLARDDIKAAIAFYEERGWDWTVVVAYLASVACGAWPPLKRSSHRVGKNK